MKKVLAILFAAMFGAASVSAIAQADKKAKDEKSAKAKKGDEKKKK